MAQIPTHGPDGSEVLSVTEFTRRVKTAIESSVPRCWVRGEVSNLTHHSNGHVYFSLKDARAQVSCVLFRQDALRLGAPLKAGQEVVALGEPSLYEPQGRYQLVCRVVVDVGQGQLQRRYEALKAKLEAEGLFSPARKRPLPAWPRVIAVVTSPTGAAIADFISILSRRGYRGRLLLLPSRVQGEGAAAEIVDAIRLAGKWATAGKNLTQGAVAGETERWATNGQTMYPGDMPTTAADAEMLTADGQMTINEGAVSREGTAPNEGALPNGKAVSSAGATANNGGAASGERLAIEGEKTFPQPDLLVVMRGGGSLEDLWPFNEEAVARALAAAPIPTISAVGHQIDFSLSDFAADVRAETPSGAAELIAASFQSLLERRQGVVRLLGREVARHLEQGRNRVQYVAQGVRAIHPARLLERHWQRLDELGLRLDGVVQTHIERQRGRLSHAALGIRSRALAAQIDLRAGRMAEAGARLERIGATVLLPLQARLKHLQTRLEGLTLQQTLGRGYALVRDKRGVVVSRKAGLQQGELLAIDFADGEILVRVEQV